MLASDVLQSDVVFVQGFDFRLEIAAEKAHEEIDFRFRTFLPVFFGERVERQGGNSDAGGGFDGGTHGGDAGAVSSNARHVTAARPAAVAVHDDGDMLGKPR